jgi:hypothetical protein
MVFKVDTAGLIGTNFFYVTYLYKAPVIAAAAPSLLFGAAAIIATSSTSTAANPAANKDEKMSGSTLATVVRLL